MGNILISLLMFADDIVLIADSAEDLEKMLDVVYNYSLKWRFRFNFDKCSVVVFDHKAVIRSLQYGSCHGKCNCGFHFRFGPYLIQQVTSYKYLGIELDEKLTLNDFKNRLVEKARVSMARIWAMGIKSGLLSESEY